MKTSFRWFGEKDDSVTLKQIRQIPGMRQIVTSLYDVPVGQAWQTEQVVALKENIESYGMFLEVIESVNIHEDIKLGSGARDEYIENYITTIKRLGEQGVKVICYNFMPVFDWLRTSLRMELPDGSNTMAYNEKSILGCDPVSLVKAYANTSNGFSLPGWEEYRLKELTTILEKYTEVDENKLFDNLQYFLKAIIPTCEKYDVKMAIHPDDPPWKIFDLPRIMTNEENLDRFVSLVDSEHNGLTLCSGSLGSNPANDIPKLIRKYGKIKRVHFGHVRNLKFTGEKEFYESAHLSSEGSLDLYEIMKAYYDIDFTGYIRPDHGRMIWDEAARPGYGLYDRALGVAYINGLWEAITKGEGRK